MAVTQNEREVKLSYAEAELTKSVANSVEKYGLNNAEVIVALSSIQSRYRMSKLVSTIDDVTKNLSGCPMFLLIPPFIFFLPFYLGIVAIDALSRISLQQAEQLLSCVADVAEKDDLKAFLVATDFRPRKYHLARLGSTLKKRQATRVADEIHQRLDLACK